MSTKALLLTLICTLSIGYANAQDKLYKKNGDMIEVKVTEITPRIVSYKKSDNIEGPSYSINKAEVSKIVYSNGSEDFFGEIKRKKSKNYGNNILSVMPMQITSGIGVGLAYERAIDKEKNILSFYMPVTVAFTDNTVDPVTGTGTTNSSAPTFFVMPGLKFYPTGGKGVVRYAVGPNLAFIQGQDYVNDLLYDNTGNIIGQDIGWRNRTALGIMITNSVNINPNEHIHLGLELGLGFTYFNQVNGRNTDVQMLGQFGFKIGYRF